MIESSNSVCSTHPIIKNINIVERKIHGSFFLIDISDNYAEDKCALYEINEVGSFIWNQIDGKRSLTDIAVELQKAIVDDIDLQVLIDDASEFVESLLAKQFVEV